MSFLALLSYPLLAAETVNISYHIGGLLALLAGILILVFPRLLNFIVAVYLIAIGLVEVFGLRV